MMSAPGKIIFTTLLLFAAVYFIARVTTDFESSRGHTEVLPERTFAVAGHVRSGENFTANPALGAAADFLESRGIKTLFLNGDTIFGNIQEAEKIAQEWNSVDEALKNFSGKVYFVSGNHDLSTPELSSYYQANIAKPIYAFTEEDVRFIILDSTSWISNEVSRRNQLEFLAGELNLWPTERPFVVFLHHPVWMNEEGSEGRAMRLVANLPNNGEIASFWLKEVTPLFSGRRGAVISGDAGRSRVKYAYKKEDGVLYLINGFDWRADADENVFFIFSVKVDSIRAFPVSLTATPRICRGLNLLYKTDVLGIPYFGRILNFAFRLPRFTACTPVGLTYENAV